MLIVIHPEFSLQVVLLRLVVNHIVGTLICLLFSSLLHFKMLAIPGYYLLGFYQKGSVSRRIFYVYIQFVLFCFGLFF